MHTFAIYTAMENRICKLFDIQYPIIQGGMIWCSGWRLASAVSNAGGLGLIGSGSMYPDVLREHIQKCKKATDKPFGVNLPLFYPDLEAHLQVIEQEGVKIVFTSAGNHALTTGRLKAAGVKVVQVISNTKFAKKAQEAGVDAIVAEGFEAGGHNGREETTTLCLIELIQKAVQVPVIAAGGIATGKSMFAAFALGAEGVQIGSRFAISEESSAHIDFKKAVIAAQEGDTRLSLKKLMPVRLLNNAFAAKVLEAEARGAEKTELEELLGRARAKKGIFEGDLQEGELEIGQVSALFSAIQPAATIINEIVTDYRRAVDEFKSF